jgi:hypothetical protein
MVLAAIIARAHLVAGCRRPWHALSLGGSPGWIMDAPAPSVAGMTAPAVEIDPALKPRRVTRG